METTLTIDDSLFQVLQAESRRTGLSLGQLIDAVLRAGLDQLHRPSPPPGRYQCQTFSLGFPPHMSLDKALDVAAHLEDEETARKIAGKA
ncbi:MAG: hypothetical protein AB1634_16930 [Thermodesulfobacteriota bacterium]